MTEPTKYAQRLAGQRVLIVGGTSGLGYGLAEALIENDCEVIISSSSATRVNDRVRELTTTYPSSRGRISGYSCNLSSRDAPEQVASLFSKVGMLDHVVHTAGDTPMVKKLEEWTLEEMQEAGMVRYFGTLLIAQHLKKHLKAAPANSFTVTSGGVADHPNPSWTVLNGYMTGLYGLTRGLALDLAPIRVNCISPGAVDTEFWNPTKRAGEYEKFLEMVQQHSTTKEIGKVEDVVEGYLYLLKDKNVTGTIISSNSGFLLV